MPRFSTTSRCAICGNEVGQSGPARQWRHLNEFYAKADHPADPAAKSYVAPRPSGAAAAAPTAKPSDDAQGKGEGEGKGEAKRKADANKPRTMAELRRRLTQGGDPPAEEPTRRRRVIDVDRDPDAGPTAEDVAVRRLRMLRMQAAEDDAKR